MAPNSRVGMLGSTRIRTRTNCKLCGIRRWPSRPTTTAAAPPACHLHHYSNQNASVLVLQLPCRLRQPDFAPPAPMA